MNSTIQNVPNSHAHSLSGESGHGGNSGGMLLLNQKNSEIQDSEKAANKFIEPVRWEKISDNDNSKRFSGLRYGYAKQVPAASRKMNPVINTEVHKEYVDHYTASLARIMPSGSTFQTLPYAVAIASAGSGIEEVHSVQRWERKSTESWSGQHPIIASRGLVQGVKQ